HHLRRKAVDLDVALVAKLDPLAAIEHAQALRHVVDRGAQQPGLAVELPAHGGEDGGKAQRGGRDGGRPALPALETCAQSPYRPARPEMWAGLFTGRIAVRLRAAATDRPGPVRH